MTAATYTAKVGFTVPSNCKVMALCDDTVETVTGVELLANRPPVATTDSWVANSNCTLSVSTGYIRATSNAAGFFEYSQTVTTVAGKRYKAYGVIENNNTSNAVRVQIYNDPNPFIELAYTVPTENGVFTLDFTATSNSTIIYVTCDGAASAGLRFDMSAVSCRTVDDDISGNDNGLMVYGSLTKAVTATNATTVAYSGFSASNFLYQPYNSALDFGTADFFIATWIKPSSFTTYNFICDRGYYTGAVWSGAFIHLYTTQTTGLVRAYLSTTGTTFDILTSNGAATVGEYTFVLLQRVSGNFQLYLDGVYDNQIAVTNASGSFDNSSAVLYVGTELPTVLPCDGALGGFRIGTGSLTASQIKTIYDNEKHLFKPDSLFTVVGESYDVDIETSGYARSRDIIKNAHKSLSGSVETVRQREEVKYNVTTTPLSIANLVEVRSLLRNVDGGESFTFDAKGSIASPYNPETVVLESESENEGQQAYNYSSTSFVVRVL